MNFTSLNVVSNAIANSSNWTGPPVSAGDPGVQLSVGSGIPANGYVQVAQMNSVREDLLFGTYRALLKMTPLAGTCTSFFWVSIRLSLFCSLVPNNFSNTTYKAVSADPS
jgi:hypothetical protein